MYIILSLYCSMLHFKVHNSISIMSLFLITLFIINILNYNYNYNYNN